jgi:hypothetical protein
MSHTLTQPEEIDQVFMEMAWNDFKVDASSIDRNVLTGFADKKWYGSYVPPYRAVHMKSMQTQTQL